MLSVVEYGKDEYGFPALVVLGCFDAIHLGHRELLKKAKLQAKINGLDLGVMTFREGKGGKLLYSFEERLALLEQFNVKFVVAIDFTEEFKATDPITFLHNLEDKINVKAYMSGKDFRFGAQAKGKSSTLKSYSEDDENGVWYMPVKDLDYNGEKISTTAIKGCLDEGNVKMAAELLGDEFSVTGEVVKGEGRGSSVVGYPTVNIFYPANKYELKHGVYSVKCDIDGTEYQGVANFGNCPTFGDERVALEVYFEGFEGDLYGRTLTVKFVDYIRDIQEFESAESLSEQISSDIESAGATVEETPAEEPEAEDNAEAVAETVEEVGETNAEKGENAEEATAEAVEEVGETNAEEVEAAEDEAEAVAETVEEVEEATAEEPEAIEEVEEATAEPVEEVGETNAEKVENAEEEEEEISSEDFFGIDMPVMKALPPLETETEVEESVEAEEVSEALAEEQEEVDFNNLASGFDEEMEEDGGEDEGDDL